MTKPILYSYWRSSCAWRVRIALELKNIDFEYRAVDLFSDQAKNDAEFSSHNPAKKVPTLVINGLSLTESMAIIEYLDEVYPNPPLLPIETDKKAIVRSIALHIASGIQPLQTGTIHRMLNNKEAGFGDTWCNLFVTKGFEALEKLLIKYSGKFCVGDQLTIADLTLPSIVYNAELYNVDMTPYPTINRIVSTLEDIEEFRKAHADLQPDAPAN